MDDTRIHPNHDLDINATGTRCITQSNASHYFFDNFEYSWSESEEEESNQNQESDMSDEEQTEPVASFGLG